MQKTATLNLRVNPEVKQSAETVLDQLGLSMSTAVDMFLRQVALTGGIPFKVALPEAPRSIDASYLSDAQLRNLLANGLSEARGGGAAEASSTLSTLRGELFGE